MSNYSNNGTGNYAGSKTYSKKNCVRRFSCPCDGACGSACGR